VVLHNKFAFEENKLINLGRVVSMTVFLYFVNSLKSFFFIYLSQVGFLKKSSFKESSGILLVFSPT
jgi:hypothetical protein